MGERSPRTKHILVLNGESRNGLAIVRSLGAQGCICEITAFGQGRLTRIIMQSLRSKFVRRVHFLPKVSHEEAFKQALLDLLAAGSFDYLLAAGTEATNFASKHKEELSRFVTPLVEDYEKLSLVHNKSTCLPWAATLGIPVPRTHIITNLDELRAAVAEIDYPVVVKYPDSSASQGLWLFPRGGDDLLAEYTRRVPEILGGATSANYPLIQERLTGDLVDTTAFAVRGETVAVLSQRRLLTAWLDGGGGLVNITNDIPRIKALTETVVRELEWTGPIEMDWIVDEQDASFALIEINPKFWGTTQLTVSSGLDYPSWLFRYFEQGLVPPETTYEPGLMGRWIFDEIVAIFTYAQGKERFRCELRGFFQRFSYSPCVTDIWPHDIRPSLLSALRVVRKLVLSSLLFRRIWQLIR